MYQTLVRTNILKSAGSSWDHLEEYNDWQDEIDRLNQRAEESGVPHAKAFQTCSVYPLMETEVVAVNGIVLAISVSSTFAILSVYLFIGSIKVLSLLCSGMFGSQLAAGGNDCSDRNCRHCHVYLWDAGGWWR